MFFLLILWAIFVVLGIVGIVRLTQKRWVPGGVLLGIGFIGGLFTFIAMVYQFTYGT